MFVNKSLWWKWHPFQNSFLFPERWQLKQCYVLWRVGPACAKFPGGGCSLCLASSCSNMSQDDWRISIPIVHRYQAENHKHSSRRLRGNLHYKQTLGKLHSNSWNWVHLFWKSEILMADLPYLPARQRRFREVGNLWDITRITTCFVHHFELAWRLVAGC